MTFDEPQMGLFFEALNFAARKHRDERRKDPEKTPYINHPIEVAETLWRVGRVREMPTLIAALLHDTLEDTDTTPQEISDQFGPDVLALVREVTDDKSLHWTERKEKQIETASHKTPAAKCLKMADKICNVHDLTASPPENWSWERRRDYFDWTEKVVAGLRGVNPALERLYDQTLAQGRAALQDEI